eukprot:221675-Chlamydomonas_euryale.AAC.1
MRAGGQFPPASRCESCPTPARGAACRASPAGNAASLPQHCRSPHTTHLQVAQRRVALQQPRRPALRVGSHLRNQAARRAQLPAQQPNKLTRRRAAAAAATATAAAQRRARCVTVRVGTDARGAGDLFPRAAHKLLQHPRQLLRRVACRRGVHWRARHACLPHAATTAWLARQGGLEHRTAVERPPHCAQCLLQLRVLCAREGQFGSCGGVEAGVR